MSTCVVTGYTPNYAEMGDFTSSINKKYCDKHGYSFKVNTSGFDESRANCWSKILFVKEALKEYEWVFWIDADAMFTNHNIRLEEISRNGGDFFICSDYPRCVFNTGTMLFRRCEFNFWLLEEIWSRHDLAWFPFHEQDAIKDIYIAKKMGEHIVWFHHRTFNGFVSPWPRELYGKPQEMFLWHKGDFIVHCAGELMSYSEKNALLRTIALDLGLI